MKIEDFIEELDAELSSRIDFHRNNQNDPHGIGNAVIAALTEVREAVEAAKTEAERLS